jgi:hypothetical protein
MLGDVFVDLLYFGEGEYGWAYFLKDFRYGDLVVDNSIVVEVDKEW